MSLSLLGAQEIQNIARLGNVRKVNLSLDFVAVVATGALRLAGARRVTRLAEVSPHFFGFEIFDGTGMGLLLGDTHLSQDIENRFAFDFQLPS
jgi:hypothetical protein